MFSLFMSPQQRAIKSLQPYVDRANALEDEVKAYSDEELKKKSLELKELAQKILPSDRNIHLTREKDKPWTAVAEGKRFVSEIDELLPYSAALIREATLRISPELRLRDVQIMCSAALAKGRLTEFFTGEGKTFVALMPLFLYGLFGRGAHLVTVNEYLAKLHGEWAGRILDKLGLTTGVITHDHAYKFVPTEELKDEEGEDGDVATKAKAVDWSKMNTLQGYNLVEVSKKEAYECDVTYGTNSEFGFDYLRDNMARRVEDVCQRELFYCIVDEADSIMVDESRTPLIISAPATESLDMYKRFAQIVARLDEDDVDIDEKDRSVNLKEEIVEKVQRMAGVSNLWEDYQASHHLDNALKARFMYKKDDHYIIQDGQVMIVDEFTGRVLPGRRWSEGLHQAVEAKENVEIQRRSSTLATVTYQNFFRLYYVLSGMTGTALTEAEEFSKIYNLDVVVIPTHLPVIRKDKTDVIYKTEEVKFKSVVCDIRERHEKGQPVLVGTTSVEKSELLSQMLVREGVEHEVLNAKHHEKEAKIVAKAGEYKAVTISTNMAGRGTDIRLGNTLEDDIAYGNVCYALRRLGVLEGVKAKGEEYGYSRVTIKAPTEIEYNKVQAAATAVLDYIKTGKLPKTVGADNRKKWFGAVNNLEGKPKIADDLDVYFRNASRTVSIGIKEGSELWDKVKPSEDELETEANLGLHVLGTERHESRRIDNQLRGRSGRQGDPGSSQFFVATQDDLMRIFGGEVIERLLSNMGVSEDLPITSGVLAKQIETAQKRVEGYNFDIRKHLVEYDDVMNEQREVFYGRRRNVLTLFKKDTKTALEGTGSGEQNAKGKKDADVPEGRFLLRDLMIKKIKKQIKYIARSNSRDNKITNLDKLWKEFSEFIPEEMAKEVVENNFKTKFSVWMKKLRKDSVGERIEESLLLLVDEAYDYKEGSVGSETMRKIERWVLLTVMDKHWTEHLDFMSDLRSAIGLRGYGQRDPLTDYKNEAFNLFAKMLSDIDENVSKRVLRVDVVKQPTSVPAITAKPQALPLPGSERTSVYQSLARQLMEKKGGGGGVRPQASNLDRAVNKVALSARTKSSTGSKPGRNDLCPCGSGKKYKKCCYPQFG